MTLQESWVNASSLPDTAVITLIPNTIGGPRETTTAVALPSAG